MPPAAPSPSTARAQKELNIEKQLKKIEDTWAALDLAFVPYMDTDINALQVRGPAAWLLLPALAGAGAPCAAQEPGRERVHIALLRPAALRRGPSGLAAALPAATRPRLPLHPCPPLPPPQIDDAIMEALESDNLQLQNMSGQKYVQTNPVFLEAVANWQKKLGTVDSVLSCWNDVQKKWQALESIFVGSADIRVQLPEDSKRFDAINAGGWRAAREVVGARGCAVWGMLCTC